MAVATSKDALTEAIIAVRRQSNRHFAFFNFVGFRTLLLKEILRFLNIPIQTLIAPVISALLFLAVFTTAWQRSDIGTVSFVSFLAGGLIVMSIMQNAFANGSTSILHCKIMGNIGDVLMPPLTPLELVLAYTTASIIRGLAVGATVGAAMWFFVDGWQLSGGWLLFYAINAAMLMSCLGLLGGVWAQKFDHMASITNFVIMPLTFLSGTFYSLSSLPAEWRPLAWFNPVHYAIDGFRYAVIGYNDSSLAVGAATCVAINAVLLFFCWLVFKTGYRLET